MFLVAHKKIGNGIDFACIYVAWSVVFGVTIVGQVLQFCCIFITSFKSTLGIWSMVVKNKMVYFVLRSILAFGLVGCFSNQIDRNISCFVQPLCYFSLSHFLIRLFSFVAVLSKPQPFKVLLKGDMYR
jgi:hypothetical protein